MASNSNAKKAEANTKKAVAALQPKSYSDPYGKFDGVTGQYTPILTDAQKQTRETGLNKINAITSAINPTPTVDDLFNNDYYNVYSKYYNDVIDTDYQKNYKQIQDNLAARNQLGSSYDALVNKDLAKVTSSNRLAAEAQARGDSANYYTQNLTNQLNTLQGLRGDLINAQNMEYQPFQNYLGYQNAVSPLQQATAQAYNIPAQFYYNQSASRDGVLNTIKNVANTYKTAIEASWSPITVPLQALGGSGGASQVGQYAKLLAGV